MDDMAAFVKKQLLENAYVTNDFSVKMHIADIYTQLAIVEEKKQQEIENSELAKGQLPSFEQIYGTKVPIKIEHLFNDTLIPRIVIQGRAGIGKSTLCQHIAYQWAAGTLWQNQFSLVLLIPLRNIVNYSDEDCQDFFTVVSKECVGTNLFGQSLLSKAQIETTLKKHAKTTLWVLDGLDEVADILDKPSLQQKILILLLNQPNAIITSRPHHIHRFINSKLCKPVDPRTLENIGFTDDHINNFIEKYLTLIKKSTFTNPRNKDLQVFLQNNPSLWGIAHIPLLLLLICHYWVTHDKDTRQVKVLSMTLLYTYLVQDMCLRYVIKYCNQPAPLLGGALLNIPECRTLLLFLRELAFEQMQKPGLIISGSDIQKRLEQYPDRTLFKQLCEFGLLKSTGKTHEIRDYQKDYYFIHLTFQEFFAAWHIAECIKARKRTIYYCIRDNKCNPRYEIVWWFVAGLLKDHPEELELYFTLLESAPIDLNLYFHTTLILKCMDEAEFRTTSARKERFSNKLSSMVKYMCRSESHGLCPPLSATVKPYLKNVFEEYFSLCAHDVFQQLAVTADNSFTRSMHKNRYISSVGGLNVVMAMGFYKRSKKHPTSTFQSVDVTAIKTFFQLLLNKPGCNAETISWMTLWLKNYDLYEKHHILARLGETEIPRCIAQEALGLLNSQDEQILVTTLKFFSQLSYTLPEVMEKISGHLKHEASKIIILNILELLNKYKHIPSEIFSTLVKFLWDKTSKIGNDDEYSHAFIHFFKLHPTVPTKVMEEWAPYFISRDNDAHRTTLNPGIIIFLSLNIPLYILEKIAADFNYLYIRPATAFHIYLYYKSWEEIIALINQQTPAGKPISYHSTEIIVIKSLYSPVPIYCLPDSHDIQIGTEGRIHFRHKSDRDAFVKSFKELQKNMLGDDLNLIEIEKNPVFDSLHQLTTLSPTIPLPAFVQEQHLICRNDALCQELRTIGNHIPEEKRHTIFISHAWQLTSHEDIAYDIQEQWADGFTVRLSEHLQLLGFNVLLDVKDSKVGHFLSRTMENFVAAADHAIVLATETWFHKYENCAQSGIKIEYSCIVRRIDDSFRVGKKDEGFLLPLICVDKVPPQFPLLDGMGGVVGFHLKLGYLCALLKLVENIYGLTYSSATLLSKYGILNNAAGNVVPSLSSETRPLSSLLNAT